MSLSKDRYCRSVRRAKLGAVLLAMLASSTVSQPASLKTEVRHHTISVQGGWWNAEVEWKIPAGLYAAVGVPWVAAILETSAEWFVPYGFRAGYQYESSPRWKFRGAAHLAGTYGRESTKCGCESSVNVGRTFLFFEIGARYEYPSGLVMGLDVPLFGLNYGQVQGESKAIKLFPPPVSFAFAQVYIGYSWR